MAVEAKACFQPQGITCSESGQAHFWLRREEPPHRNRRVAGHEDLKAILAGVATSGDQALRTFQRHPEALTEGHRLQVGGADALQHLHCFWPLQGKKATVVPHHLHFHIATKLAQLLLKVLQVFRRAARVHHLVHVFPMLLGVALCDQGIINDTAALVGDDAERPGHRWESVDICSSHPLHKVEGVLSSPPDTAHVAHVKERSALSSPFRRIDDAECVLASFRFVLHWHSVACKVHHLAALLRVFLIGQGALQICGEAARPMPCLRPKMASDAHHGAC
mmetsp:Transcript_136757/g.324035  ORF Transcript_136757/g.324035 Transcript_136757/m.324035 type:complete len:278 (+) Transcript_136757:505-1338(+)